jgi:hypothetical protein
MLATVSVFSYKVVTGIRFHLIDFERGKSINHSNDSREKQLPTYDEFEYLFLKVST